MNTSIVVLNSSVFTTSSQPVRARIYFGLSLSITTTMGCSIRLCSLCRPRVPCGMLRRTSFLSLHRQFFNPPLSFSSMCQLRALHGVSLTLQTWFRSSFRLAPLFLRIIPFSDIATYGQTNVPQPSYAYNWSVQSNTAFNFSAYNTAIIEFNPEVLLAGCRYVFQMRFSLIVLFFNC